MLSGAKEGGRRVVLASEHAAAWWGVCACMNSWASGLRRPVNKHVGVGHCEATLFSSVSSHRRLSGSPGLRVPCVFGQRLNDYHPFEGFIVVFYFAVWGKDSPTTLTTTAP